MFPMVSCSVASGKYAVLKMPYILPLWLAGASPDLRKLMDHTPLGAALGPEGFHHNLFKALEAWRQRVGPKANGA